MKSSQYFMCSHSHSLTLSFEALVIIIQSVKWQQLLVESLSKKEILSILLSFSSLPFLSLDDKSYDLFKVQVHIFIPFASQQFTMFPRNFCHKRLLVIAKYSLLYHHHTHSWLPEWVMHSHKMPLDERLFFLQMKQFQDLFPSGMEFHVEFPRK